MEGELKNLIQVWSLAFVALFYCYFFSSKIPKGSYRLLSIFPVIILFLLLPLRLSSAHLTGLTAFFLTWLAAFRLLLFSFGHPPLSPPSPHLLHFLFTAFLPIKIRKRPNPNPETQVGHQIGKQVLILTIKVAFLAIVFQAYEYKEKLHKNVILLLYCLHLYLELELVLALCGIPTRALLNMEIEPQSDDPFLATSLQDFWGRRWNLTVTGILRPTVYSPIRRVSTPLMGSRWAQSLAVCATFLVSGLMHELIYYYFIRVPPTWEVTWFFTLHGVCVVLEVAVKRAAASSNGGWRLHPAVSRPLTLAFVAATGLWLFFPQIVRNGVDEKVIEEGSVVMDFVKGLVARPFMFIWDEKKRPTTML